MRVRNFSDALALYAELAKQSQSSDFLYEHGGAAAVSGDFDLADEIWQKLLDREPDNADLALRLSADYGRLSLRLKALDLCIKAANLQPHNLAMQISLLSKLAPNNSIEKARIILERCLALDPNNQWVCALSGQLDRRENNLEIAEGKFRDLLAAGSRDSKVMYSCHMELALILDQTERFDEAMAMLDAAKRIAAQTVKVEEQRKAFDERCEKVVRTARSLPLNILDTWNKSLPAEARTTAPALAFLGGHMRSGTTLLERIIDAHPSAIAFDESLAFQTIAPLIDVTAPDIPAQTLNFLRQRYLKNLVVDTGPPGEGKTLLDKIPPATTELPSLLRAFPELRVLIALRDPRDVLVSSYFVKRTHLINLSLEKMAQNYRTVMDVWLAVRGWKGLAWMETRYEDVVANLEKEGRRVTKFLGLEWHENQARYYESNPGKPVRNYNEVTKPVYTKAIGRWRSYEKYLAPIMPILEPYCKEFGYSSD